MTRLAPIALGAVLVAAVASASTLSIAGDEPPLEGTGLSESQLFARIDSLEADLPEAHEADRSCAATCLRLGQLYLSLNMHEHNWHALEYLERATNEDPDSFEAARVRASALWDMVYERDARLGFEDMADEHTGDPRPYWLLGRLHFRRARRTLSERDFERARQSFLRGVQLDPAHADCLHGLAATQLALERWTELRATARSLVERMPDQPLGHFLEGAALSALDERAAAGDAFQRALDLSDAQTRSVFVSGEGFLDEYALGDELPLVVDPARLRERIRDIDADWESGDRINDRQARHAIGDPEIRDAVVAQYWRSVNTWPTHLLNSRQLRFYQRLVEADVLFGDSLSGARGWDSWPGRVLVRWGRPHRVHYAPPGFQAHINDWYDDGVRLPVSEDVRSDQQIMIWTYRSGATWFSLLFTDATSHFRWYPGDASTVSYEARARERPMIFFDGEEQPRFTVTQLQHNFPRQQYTRLESSISVLSEDGFEPFERLVDDQPTHSLLSVEWAIYDWTERRVEYVRRELDEENLRRSLLDALHRPGASPGQELLCQINAALPPGEYRLAVDVSSPTLGHSAQQFLLMVPNPDPPGFLSISDLLLAETFEPMAGALPVPGEFIRYAHAVLPRPSRRFRADDSAHVYFEIYNLATDDNGQTRFNVHYRVHRVLDDRVPQRGQVLDPSMLEVLELASTSFLEERTGLSADGHVVKGSAIDLGSLEGGDYLLEIEVEDLLVRESTRRFVRFRYMGP